MSTAASSHDILLLGASGLVGRAVLADAPERMVAVSRSVHAGGRAPSWVVADLYRDAIPFGGETVLSAGPLDGLLAWLGRENPRGLKRIVALSSTSVHTKQDSADPQERALAARLRDAEALLIAWCASRGVRWTLLRPTLIYDDAFAGALGRFVAIARRIGAVALPSDARGLRQPVHAADVAGAMRAALVRDAARDHAYDLPGGETLDYRRMVARTLAVAAPGARLLALSPWLFAFAAPAARRLPALAALTPEVLARMREDLVFDAGPATRDLGHAPRRFPGAPAAARPG
ncbi:MAG: nucleoside-diphosphate sugar epimerase [Xanthomonadaceae bacterium]|nr:nucleoside-diphosphate sugar epimerase [Xanthomonadaceae bacterium]